MSSDSSATLRQTQTDLTNAYRKSGLSWNDFLIGIGARRKDEPPMAEPPVVEPPTISQKISSWNLFNKKETEMPAAATATAAAPEENPGMFSGFKKRVNNSVNSAKQGYSNLKDQFKSSNNNSGSGSSNNYSGPKTDYTRAIISSFFSGGRKSKKQSKSRKQGKSRKQRKTRK